jgi:glyoxylase-like metal-dependent hydrolase (beta-lactamase superfamily II)
MSDSDASDTRYTGQVEVGGPMDVRELPQITIAKLAVGPMSNNCYLLRCRASGAALLIDAANEAPRVVEFVRFGGGPPTSVLTTHQHADHWQALASVVAQTGARTLAGARDAGGIPVPTDRTLHHGDRVQVGQLELAAIELRGHTPGSIALYYADPDGSGHLFTGDALFPGGPGRTTNPGDFNSLMDDVTERIFDVYDDDTWFYPGHGDDSTLGAERPHLDAWRARGW